MNQRASETPLIALCTCPDEQVAERIAATLVENRLAACVNIVAGIRSIYRWQDEVQRDSEHLLIIKTTPTRYPEVESAVRQMHPYELPEVIAVSIDRGLTEYLSWIGIQTEKGI